jgi:murein DD-endopeptidase MepM/ murein hydrolase activator NlpD
MPQYRGPLTMINCRSSLKALLIIFLISHIGQPAVAQQTPAKTDSSEVYKDIETYSQKSKFTKFIYSLVFKPTASPSFKKRRHKPPQKPYSDFEGKIIRNINIVTLDPFGFSVNDTTAIPQNFIFNSGNKLHVKTQYITIKNLLLFSANEPFDSLLVKESERLIRGQHYVREVLLSVVPVKKSTDSVDVHIRVVDKWSTIPHSNATTARVTVGLTENNFIGLGHEFHNAYTWNHADRKNAFTTNYFIPNIRNSYISTVLHYNIDENHNFGKSITVERPFYSPLARWAAGLNMAQIFQEDILADTASGYVKQNLKYNTQDYWAGSANRLSRGKTEDERTTNAIIAARYLRIRYLEKPDEVHDSLHIYSNEDFYLAGIGISTRKYFQDNYVFNFGVIEDVPVGKVYGITGGYQIRDNAERLYLGSRISFGNYYECGYLSSNFEYGTFFHGSSCEQGVFTAGANYFSDLIEIGNWQIRQFIKPQVTWGLNRFSYESLTINDENGIRGFTTSLRGTKKIVLTLQTQSYAPWSVLGFRFGPYLICSLGMLGNTTSGFKTSRVSSLLGLGALIKNEYLVLSNFHFSIAYYPSVPGNRYGIIKLNSFITTDFGFRDFNFGKPEIVAFQ